MSLLNSILTSLFSLLVLPLRGLSPFWALAIISLVAGILMLWIFGKVSNQEAIKRIRTTIGGNLIGARLYRHDIGVVTRLQARVIRDTFIYMRYSLAPMLIMFIPMTVILTQLNLNFESRPLKKGEKTLLKAKVRGEESLSGKIEIEVPKGIIVETPPVRIPSEREIAWRLRAVDEGRHSVKIKLGDRTIEKEIVVGGLWGQTPALRTGNNIFEKFLYPGESPIPSVEPISSIEIKYPELRIKVFGWTIHWMVLFFILSIVFGFAFKDLFGVQI